MIQEPARDALSIGINLGFAALDPGLDDEAMYHGELDLAIQAETLGYDSVWVVEHHFEDYSLCPDNLLLLAHLRAARRGSSWAPPR